MDSKITGKRRKEGDAIEREQMQANIDHDYGNERPTPQEQKENLADLILKQRDELTALRAANRDLQQWFDDARAEAEKAQERIKDLEQVATSVRRDLMLRAEPDWDGSGQQVVNLSASIWDELNRVLDIKGNRREGSR